MSAPALNLRLRPRHLGVEKPLLPSLAVTVSPPPALSRSPMLDVDVVGGEVADVSIRLDLGVLAALCTAVVVGPLGAAGRNGF